MYDAVLRLHKALGMDPEDPSTTWRWEAYEPPVSSNHEANAHNRWHLLLLAGALALAAAARSRPWLLYGCALVAETSCEMRNDYLDRALVVPILDLRDAAFFQPVS